MYMKADWDVERTRYSRACMQLSGKPCGQLTQKYSDLVTNISILISEKHGKLVASEKNLIILVTPEVAMSSSVLQSLHYVERFKNFLYTLHDVV